MEKSGSFSQNTRIFRGQTGAVKANQTDFKADMHHQLVADDAHYRADKLGLGKDCSHEGWIKAEEAEASWHSPVDVEVRHRMIAVAAYYLAEKRGFQGNYTDEDWIRAEAEVDIMLHDRI